MPHIVDLLLATSCIVGGDKDTLKFLSEIGHSYALLLLRQPLVQQAALKLLLKQPLLYILRIRH